MLQQSKESSQRIMSQQGNTVTLVSGNFDCGNITNSYNTINVDNKTKTEEDREIKKWLSPLEPKDRHNNVVKNRLDGVGNWFLETKEFRQWSSSKDGSNEPVLFCYGDPGVGKTHLSSLVIDRLNDQVGEKDIAVAGLYCDYLAQEEQSATNMLGAILKQLLERDEIQEHVRQIFRRGKKVLGGRAVLLSELVGMLKMAIASLPRVFICIDALDECLPKCRRELLDSLREIVRELPTTRIFLTGRPHIRDEVETYLSGAVMVRIAPTEDDIRRYLEMRLDRDTEPVAMDNALRAEIMKVIPETISQIFLLVALNIDAILEEVTIYRRRKKLHEMIKGNGLQDAYSATLARMKAQKGSKSRLGMQVLMWVSHAERPLEVDELCHALGVEIGSTDLNAENIPAIETLLGCSLGLVIIEASSFTVRLVHFTLQEYLSGNPELFHSPHSMIAEVCLTYLNFQCIRELSPALDSAPSTAPFLEYASCYWGAHARRGITESVKSLALRLLGEYDKHISSKLLLLRDKDDWDEPFDEEGSYEGFTGLHGVAYIGIVEIAVALLEIKEWDINKADARSTTAIGWAVREGHDGVLRVLLEQEDADPDTVDKDGRTPLSWAAESGNEEAVRLLLDRKDVAPDKAGADGQTPLSWAARFENEKVVRLLLDRKDVAPDKADADGRTPLSWAVRSGNEEAMIMLLEHEDVAPDKADVNGRTPLWWAAMYGNEEAMMMLLEREDVAPDKADANGRTPLSWAAMYGNEEATMMLLEREDVAPDKADTNGRTPLSWAAGERYAAAVVKMLLGCKDVAPDKADAKGRTPLSWAAQYGNEKAVRLLLEHENAAPGKADADGRTPLSWAAENGQDKVVKMLLEQHDANADTADMKNRTPLFFAVRHGRDKAVKLLLRRGDINPNTADNEHSQTPLLWAASRGYSLLVKILLDRKDINPDLADKNDRTPLFFAAANGWEGVAEILLQREDVNPDLVDINGRTPLSWAAEYGHTRVVEMLLERSSASLHTIDHSGRVALMRALENRHMAVIKLLLEWQSFISRAADGNIPTDSPPDESSEPSRPPSKRLRRS